MAASKLRVEGGHYPYANRHERKPKYGKNLFSQMIRSGLRQGDRGLSELFGADLTRQGIRG